jgi:hypothetical protein
MLSSYCCSMNCLKWLRMLNVPLKESCFFLLYGSILLWYCPLMLYLGWLGACSHHVWLQTSCLKPLWSFSFWFVISLYALVNNVLSLCMIMAVIALLVGRSQSFASLHLYWEGTLLVHPTPKNQVISKSPLQIPMHGIFEPFQSKFSCATFQNLQNTFHFVTLFSAHEDVVVGFVIFHIELSTPWLSCFICSSLILEGSWSDHCNLKKRHSSMVCESWWAPEGFG